MARRRLPPLKALPAFEEAARLLSFSAAARELNLTHGAISRQMKSLETHLGVPLFRRLSRRLELTEAGPPSCRRHAARSMGSRRARPACRPATRQGPLVVACLPTFMMRWLIPRLYDFNARHPSVEVRLSASSGPIDFARQGVDVAIRIGAPPWPAGIEAHRLHEARRSAPVCSPSLLKKGRLDLARPRAPAYRDPSRRMGRLVGAQRHASRRRHRAEQRFEHFYFLLEAAVAGLGVAVAPRPLVSDDLKQGRLVAPFGFVTSGRRYYLLHPAELAQAAKVRTFRVVDREGGTRPFVAGRPRQKQFG